MTQEAPEANLTLLGQKVPLPTTIDGSILEPIPNRWLDSDYDVNLICEEFTSLCPVTNQPDFARIFITYKPDQWLVESKSLKLYLGGYRNQGTFAEYATNQICQDLVKILQPKSIEVRCEFTARGGIKIVPVARWTKAAAV
ncbi:MAG: preQ(1) synthase [Chlamydiales bacterium]|nr:preQ(1) synthase [Chlamydiales bacterium]